MNIMKPRTVVSIEQALSLPYATWRFAHLGWRVIRIEATPRHILGEIGIRNDEIESMLADSTAFAQIRHG